MADLLDLIDDPDSVAARQQAEDDWAKELAAYEAKRKPLLPSPEEVANKLKSFQGSTEREPGYIYGNILPFRRQEAYVDPSGFDVHKRGPIEWGLGYSNVLKSISDAFKAPGRALAGEQLGPEEAMNFALNVMGGGTTFGSAPVGSVGMAVKAPGGVWHPEAVEHVAEPLYTSLARGLEHELPAPGEGSIGGRGSWQDASDIGTWTNKATKNYLQKYAGTERDPLKNVEVPYMEGTRRWEDLWDESITQSQAGPLTRWLGEDPGMKGAVERGDKYFGVGNVGREGTPPAGIQSAFSAEALRDYMGHVGDYLRQNVIEGKWGPKFYAANKELLESPQFKAEHDNINQFASNETEYVGKVRSMLKAAGVPFKDVGPLEGYDMTRAVRETAAHDAKVAKEMEKAQAATNKDLPVYKEYPDKFKWVELKAPEKLTPEQAKMVRRNPNEASEFQALDSKGEPITNNYTGEPAVGSTPEEAWLAGRLAEEGNQMGHCVGGYCEPVASGDTRILSLRDPKGKSHITVELAPGEASVPSFMAQAPKHVKDKILKEVGNEPADSKSRYEWAGRVKDTPEYQEWKKEMPQRILQIKGKQNRAPVREYQKYAQDLVKSGKWGDIVGDISNTGLLDKTRAFNKLEDEINTWQTRDFVPGDIQSARKQGAWRNEFKSVAKNMLGSHESKYLDDQEYHSILMQLRAMKNGDVRGMLDSIGGGEE